jgi:hypothetical protein
LWPVVTRRTHCKERDRSFPRSGRAAHGRFDFARLAPPDFAFDVFRLTLLRVRANDLEVLRDAEDLRAADLRCPATDVFRADFRLNFFCSDRGFVASCTALSIGAIASRARCSAAAIACEVAAATIRFASGDGASAFSAAFTAVSTALVKVPFLAMRISLLVSSGSIMTKSNVESSRSARGNLQIVSAR